MIALWIACTLLAFGAVYLLAKLILVKRDVRQIGRRLEEIMTQDTNAKLSTQSFDGDISRLIQGANALLAKSRQDHVNALRTEADLKRAIVNISHDLRTPLTSAKGYLQMLADAVQEGGKPGYDIANPPPRNSEALRETSTHARYLDIIQSRLETLAVLMDSLFAFSRAMEESVIIKQVNIGNTLRDVLSASYEELTQMGFTVESHIPDAPVYAQCDENALTRVLENLVKNAYVHGKEYLGVKLDGQVIEIANKADGLEGIDTAQMFDRFYTADAARTHKRTGLGLAIARELVGKMGGRIWALREGGLLVMRVSFVHCYAVAAGVVRQQ